MKKARNEKRVGKKIGKKKKKKKRTKQITRDCPDNAAACSGSSPS